MKRVCVVVTARPSYSRIKTVLLALQKTPGIELQVVAAASALLTRYGAVVDVMRKDGIEITVEVPCVLDGSGLRESVISTGLLTAQLATAFTSLRPDMVLTIADRHETLATAIAASYQNIPLCHLQGGEHTGSIDEKVRWAVSELADLHLVATETAKDELLRSPSIQGPIVLTGCPSIDLAREAKEIGPINSADVIVLYHPDTTEAEAMGYNMRVLIDALRGLNVLWFWPGEDAGGEAMCKRLRMAGVAPVRNMAPVQFLRHLMGAKVLVGNSSVGHREGSFLGVPAVVLGKRQWNREHAGNIVTVLDHNAESIRHWVEKLPTLNLAKPSTLYGDGHAAEKCVAAILDYLQ